MFDDMFLSIASDRISPIIARWLVYLRKTLLFNEKPSIMDIRQLRTIFLVPRVSIIEGFYCIIDDTSKLLIVEPSKLLSSTMSQ